MRIEYFPETDSVYIDLAERAAADSWEIGEGIIVDVDLIGVPLEAELAAG